MSEERITYVGCKDAREITLTRAGANPGALVLARKSRKARPAQRRNPAPTEPNPESSDMDAKLMFKALAGMDDVTRSYAAALPDDKIDAFVAKSSADQKKEAHDAAAEVERTKAEEAARAAGKSAREVELERENADIRKRLDALDAAEVERKADAQFAEVARAEFAGYPGGPTAAATMLKTASKVSKEEGEGIRSMMKAQIATAQASGVRKSAGGDAAVGDTSQPATKAYNEAIKKHMDEKGVKRSTAAAAIHETPVGKRLMEAAQEEQDAARQG